MLENILHDFANDNLANCLAIFSAIHACFWVFFLLLKILIRTIVTLDRVVTVVILVALVTIKLLLTLLTAMIIVVVVTVVILLALVVIFFYWQYSQ